MKCASSEKMTDAVSNPERLDVDREGVIGYYYFPSITRIGHFAGNRLPIYAESPMR
jgi:hypothetical protein